MPPVSPRRVRPGSLSRRQCGFYRAQVVFQQGDPADLFYVLLEGEVSVYTTTKRQLLDSMRRNLIAR